MTYCLERRRRRGGKKTEPQRGRRRRGGRVPNLREDGEEEGEGEGEEEGEKGEGECRTSGRTAKDRKTHDRMTHGEKKKHNGKSDLEGTDARYAETVCNKVSLFHGEEGVRGREEEEEEEEKGVK